MSLLEKLNTILSEIAPTRTGFFDGMAPDTYFVLIPLYERFEAYADDRPTAETQEIMVALYCKGNYQAVKNQAVTAIINEGLTVTDRSYIEYEKDTGYHHYSIDVLEVY